MTKDDTATQESAAPAGQDVLTFRSRQFDVARRIAAALEELFDPAADAVACFEDGDGYRIDALYHAAPDAAELAAALSSMLAERVDPPLQSRLEDRNWVAISQAALPPVEAGRFTIHGSHDRMRVPRGPLHVEIDAGEAFGTAHHATTTGCLIAIDSLARHRRFERVLDLGCGTGVLAIVAQRLMPAACVLASDIDPVAIDVARANARINGTVSIECLTAAGVPRPRRHRAAAGYDLLIANILAGPLIRMAAGISRAVAPNGVLVLSGLLVRQEREVLGAYLSRGLVLLDRRHIAGWATLTLQKRPR